MTGSLWPKDIVPPSPRAKSFLCLKGLHPTEATKPTAQKGGSRLVIGFCEKGPKEERSGGWESLGEATSVRDHALRGARGPQASGCCEDWPSHSLLDT